MIKTRFFLFKYLTFLFIISLFVSLSASSTYRNLHIKSKKQFSLLERIYTKYPIEPQRREQLKNIRENWNNLEKEYQSQAGIKQKYVLRKMKSTYNDILFLMQNSSKTLESYSNDILSDITEKIQKIEKAKFQKFIIQFSVSKREFQRAKKAYRHKQFYYSSHLFNRGIIILNKIYKELNWNIPIAYSGL